MNDRASRAMSWRAHYVVLGVLLMGFILCPPFAPTSADGTCRVELPLIIRATSLLPTPLPAMCTDVVDGDTIRVLYESVLSLDLRYIGVNTPERGKCHEDEATARNRELVEDKQILFQRDVRQKDSWNRFLGYVYVDGLFVNEILVSEGLGVADAHDPDITHAGLLMRAECAAREAKRGTWAHCQIKPDVPVEAPGPVILSRFIFTGEDESVRISNTGGIPVDLTDWTLVSAVGGEVFSFANADALSDGDVLAPYHSIYVHTGPDTTLGDLGTQWRRSRVWNDAGDEARLYNAEGRLVDAWPYGDQIEETRQGGFSTRASAR